MVIWNCCIQYRKRFIVRWVAISVVFLGRPNTMRFERNAKFVFLKKMMLQSSPCIQKCDGGVSKGRSGVRPFPLNCGFLFYLHAIVKSQILRSKKNFYWRSNLLFRCYTKQWCLVILRKLIPNNGYTFIVHVAHC